MVRDEEPGAPAEDLAGESRSARRGRVRGGLGGSLDGRGGVGGSLDGRGGVGARLDGRGGVGGVVGSNSYGFFATVVRVTLLFQVPSGCSVFLVRVNSISPGDSEDQLYWPSNVVRMRGGLRLRGSVWWPP